MPTAYPLRVQAIRSRGQNPRLDVSFPLALAAAIGLEPGEAVQWDGQLEVEWAILARFVGSEAN